MTFRECFDRERQMSWWSFIIGIPVGLYLASRPICRECPETAVVILPIAWVLTVECVIRFIGWVVSNCFR